MSIIDFGDSITGRRYNNNNATRIANDTRGYWSWANVLLRHRFKTLNMAGVTGDQTANMLARIGRDVLAYAPGYCVVQGGVNDCSNNLDAATIETNLAAIYQTLLASGVTPIATTITPNGAHTAAQNTVRCTVNGWMKDFCRTHRGILLCDFASAVTDLTTATWLAGLSTDFLHPVTAGAARMGKALAAVLADVTAAVDVLPASPTDTPNLCPNPLTNGNTAGVATGWAVSAGVAAKVARTDLLPGEWQQITTAAPTAANVNRSISSGFSVGDAVYGECEFQTDPFTSYTIPPRLLLLARDAGFATIMEADDLTNISLDTPLLETQPAAGVLRTPVMVLPPGTASIKIAFDFNGQGTVRATRFGIYRP